MTADDAIDELYGVTPERFTALRTELAAAAKKRGDAVEAKRIAAARRPTTAAWVVNVLVRHDGDARRRMNDLAEGLRAAHATMDGARIRELSITQRRLVDELVRAGFAAVGLAQPSAALRDDVVGTLQAAIADPDVAARLGRLAKAERWSGFGDFGSVSTVGAVPKPKPSPQRTNDPAPADAVLAAARQRVAATRNDAEAAERAQADAVAALEERAAAVASARRRYEKLLTTLHAAEEELSTADVARGDAEQAALAAADRLGAATSAAALAESELAALVERQAP